MTTFRRIFALPVAAVMAVGIASAGSISQSFNIGPNPTDVGFGQTDKIFDYWQNTAHPVGALLTGVRIEVNISESLASLSFTNPLTTTQTFAFLESDAFNLFGSLATAARNQVRAGGGGIPNSGIGATLYSIGDPSNSDFQTIMAGETLNYIPTLSPNADNPFNMERGGTGTVIWDSGLVNISDITSFDAAGTFDMFYNTVTSTTNSGGGGNLNAFIQTSTSGTFNVIYDYTTNEQTTPEPATLALMGGALIGLGVLRKRSAR